MMRFIRDLLSWTWRMLRKGIWALGLLPSALDYLHAYLPKKYVPDLVTRFVDLGVSLQLSVTLIVVALFVSSYLVYQDAAKRLRIYEDQAPVYRVHVMLAEGWKSPLSHSIIVHCTLRIIAQSIWRGFLASAYVFGERSHACLEPWEVHSHEPDRGFPFEIPHPSYEISVKLVSNLVEGHRLGWRSRWRSVRIPLRLAIKHPLRPIGEAYQVLPADFKVNLLEAYDEISSQRKTERIYPHNKKDDE